MCGGRDSVSGKWAGIMPSERLDARGTTALPKRKTRRSAQGERRGWYDWSDREAQLYWGFFSSAFSFFGAGGPIFVIFTTSYSVSLFFKRRPFT
jgi:hypothetical protein